MLWSCLLAWDDDIGREPTMPRFVHSAAANVILVGLEFDLSSALLLTFTRRDLSLLEIEWLFKDDQLLRSTLQKRGGGGRFFFSLSQRLVCMRCWKVSPYSWNRDVLLVRDETCWCPRNTKRDTVSSDRKQMSTWLTGVVQTQRCQLEPRSSHTSTKGASQTARVIISGLDKTQGSSKWHLIRLLAQSNYVTLSLQWSAKWLIVLNSDISRHLELWPPPPPPRFGPPAWRWPLDLSRYIWIILHSLFYIMSPIYLTSLSVYVMSVFTWNTLHDKKKKSWLNCVNFSLLG